MEVWDELRHCSYAGLHAALPQISDETTSARWLDADDATDRMTTPFAARVKDALRNGAPRVGCIASDNIMAPKT
jgi:hypothetical protein